MLAEIMANQEAVQTSNDSIHSAGEFTDSKDNNTEAEFKLKVIEKMNSSSLFFASLYIQLLLFMPKWNFAEEHGLVYLAVLFKKSKEKDASDGSLIDKANCLSRCCHHYDVIFC